MCHVLLRGGCSRLLVRYACRLSMVDIIPDRPASTRITYVYTRGSMDLDFFRLRKRI
ncbi:hypothetical protein BDR03DRAFT_962985 [Suillus americanus]|nr:hypothetical protein BDR03DRAFT_962985 [Suillus americanus]